MTLSARLIGSCLLAAVLPLRAAPGPAQKTEIFSDAVDSQSTNRDTTSFFTGHVVVTGNDIRMTCDKLEVITLRTGAASDTLGKQDQFKYLLATGSVDIHQGEREATCGRAEILPQDNKITLTETPVVTDHGNGTVFTGEKLILLRGERRVLGEHVHITAPAIKDLGFSKNQQQTPLPPLPAESP